MKPIFKLDVSHLANGTYDEADLVAAGACSGNIKTGTSDPGQDITVNTGRWGNTTTTQRVNIYHPRATPENDTADDVLYLSCYLGGGFKGRARCRMGAASTSGTGQLLLQFYDALKSTTVYFGLNGTGSNKRMQVNNQAGVLASSTFTPGVNYNSDFNVEFSVIPDTNGDPQVTLTCLETGLTISVTNTDWVTDGVFATNLLQIGGMATASQCVGVYEVEIYG